MNSIEEILNILESAKDDTGSVPMRLVRQAFDKLFGSCEDAVSRQEAIDAVEQIVSSRSVCINSDEYHGMKRMQKQAVIELTNLPPAQPERPKGHWIDTGSGQECSECGEVQYGYDNFRYYCAKCGSDNRGKQDG